MKSIMKKLVLFIALCILVSCSGKNEVFDQRGQVVTEKKINDCVVKKFKLTLGKHQRIILTMKKPDGSIIELKTMGMTFNVGDTVDIDVIGRKINPELDSLNFVEIL